MTASDGPAHDVTVNVQSFHAVPEPLVRDAVLHVLNDADSPAAEISVTFLDDQAIRVMNRDYLDRDAPTDVIAFSLGEAGGRILGDVYVGFVRASRQAAALGIPLNEELVRLVIHGTLHVLGHDHPEDDGRTESRMYRLQERLVGDVLKR